VPPKPCCGLRARRVLRFAGGWTTLGRVTFRRAIELVREHSALVSLTLLAALFAWTILHFIYVRHEGREQGAAACLAKGHDRAWCDTAWAEYGEECETLTLDIGGGSRFATHVPQGLDKAAYVTCVEIGPVEWSRARAAAAKASRDAVRRDRQP